MSAYRFLRGIRLGILGGALSLSLSAEAAKPFVIEEATISDIQQAIKSGRASCSDVVNAYIERAKAYNGVCTELVTKDGAPVPAFTGTVRAESPLKFPTHSRPVSALLADLDRYKGLPLDLGRMDVTASNPSVYQQYGMVVGWPKSGQLNALETLNIRGERSVSCRAECDTSPSQGALPTHCPVACEAFRRYPDARERAAELDARYGKRPDLDKLPLYCTTASIKNWYDVKDMRSTGGNDVNFAMDAPPRDANVVAALRDKGAIILGVSIAAEIGMRADGPVKPTRNFVGGSGSIRSSWAGHTCNPYDTERSAGPSSGGAGVSVAANLVTFAICETTGGSCREPANQNAVTSLVTTKGLMSEYGTATAQHANHRPGILARKLGDAVRVLDAIRTTQGGYFDSSDVFTAQPKAFVTAQPYASFVINKVKGKPLQGMRIAIVREYMVKHTPNDGAISDRVDSEIKKVLRDQLGAEIVESIDPQYPDDSDVPNLRYTFADAFSELLPLTAPEYLLQKTGDSFEFAVPGYDVSSLDYRVKLALRQAPLSKKLNMRRILSGLDDGDLNEFSMAKYLAERGDARVKDWPSYAANAKWRAETQAAGAANAALQASSTRLATGMDRIKMREVLRMAVLKVMYENQIDIFVHPNLTVPQWKIGVDREPTVDGRVAAGPSITDLLGVPEIIVPAGFDATVYEPHFALATDQKNYVLKTGAQQSTMSVSMPFSIYFWAGPGDEAAVLKVSSAYEVATGHRLPPPDFGPVPVAKQ